MRLRHRRIPDTIDCHEVLAKLQSYLDDEIDDVNARRISDHLLLCRGCGLEAATYRSIKDALARRGVIADTIALGKLQQFAADLAAQQAGRLGGDDRP